MSSDQPFSVLVDRRVEKDLATAPPHVVRAFMEALARLAQDPLRRRPGCDVKPLRGMPESYRLRLGSWRVLYHVDLRTRTVRVTTAGPRGNVYE